MPDTLCCEELVTDTSQLAHCADADPLNVWLDLKILHHPTDFAASMMLRQKYNSMKNSCSQSMANWI